eukprot:7386635-Pyramimonas_sp.AAC.1
MVRQSAFGGGCYTMPSLCWNMRVVCFHVSPIIRQEGDAPDLELRQMDPKGRCLAGLPLSPFRNRCFQGLVVQTIWPPPVRDGAFCPLAIAGVTE